MKNQMFDKFSADIYGTPELEPVFLEVIKSKPLQRLHKIQQHGPMVWVWKDAYETRYDHSIGVMLLIRHFGGTIEEQLAGLLHDVSHTAFSHAIDYMESTKTKSFHEDHQEKIISQSEIPNILKKYQISLDQVIKSDHHKLLDTELPDLCADRVDYCFRDGFAVGFITKPEIKKMLNSLITHNGEIVFSNASQALKFSRLFARNNKENYASDFGALFNQLLADALDIGIKEKIISVDDLFTDDEAVKEKLVKSNNREILERLSLISKTTKIIKVKRDHQYHLRTIRVRVVDPKVVENGKTKRLSEIYPSYKKIKENSQRKQESGFNVRVIPNARVVKKRIYENV